MWDPDIGAKKIDFFSLSEVVQIFEASPLSTAAVFQDSCWNLPW
jgi:hypothetical protein